MTPESAERIRRAVAQLGDAILAAVSEGAPADGPDRLYTVEEAAERLRVARSTLYGLISSGALRSVRVGGRRVVPSGYLREYLERAG